MTARAIGDLSHLPASGFRQHGLWFWAGAGFMLIEGTAFVLAAAAYVLLMNEADQWPLASAPPNLFWGTAAAAVFVASLVPNFLVSHSARKRDVRATQRWALVMSALGVSLVVLRTVELGHLNTRWDQDAYGSIVWALVILHTAHLVTDVLDTLFLTVFLFTHPVDNERFSDTDDNAGYWTFIALSWVAYYVIVYWAPRWAA